MKTTQRSDPRVKKTRAALLLTLAGAWGSIPVSAGIDTAEQTLLDALDTGRVLTDMQLLSASADGIAQGVGEGSVVAGSSEETALAAQLAGRLRALGLTVQVEEFPVRAWRYAPPRLVANGRAIPAISLHATGAVNGLRDGLPFARGNADGGRRLEVPLVDAGEGYAPDYARIGDVRGKAVLVRRDLRDWPPAQISEAAHRGAVAVIFHDHPGSADRLDALRQDSLWGHEQLPALAISIRSARELQRALGEGPVSLELSSSMELRDGHSRNVLALIEGSEYPDQWVLVSAHYDRWFRGGLDNVAGTAALMELAAAVFRTGMKPRRTLAFLLVGSEEAGLADPERDWLAGSHAFLQAHPEVFRQAALVANIDGFGWGAAQAHLGVTPDRLAEERRTLQDLGLEGAIALRPFTYAAIDAWTYGVLGGAATTHLFTMDEAYSAIYHTQEDVVAPERFPNIGRDLSLLALSVSRAAMAERQTPDLAALADDLRDRYAAESKRLPGMDVTSLQAAIAEFRAAAIRSAGNTRRPAHETDQLLMQVRHALVPWVYAADGEFTQAARSREYANRVEALDAALRELDVGNSAAALAALATFYEGRQCQRISAEVYAAERAFWAGEGGWASRFGHRASPPLPAFDAACRTLVAGNTGEAAVLAGLRAARTEALQAASAAHALVEAKLREATATLRRLGGADAGITAEGDRAR
jgi:hypothetical protein